MNRKPNSLSVNVDFDGVVHDYVNGWVGIGVVDGGPVPGAIKWLYELLEAGFTVNIVSSRNSAVEGIQAMQGAIDSWARECPEFCEDERGHVADRLMLLLRYPTGKPPAIMLVDDRVWCFQGSFPTLDEIRDFRPWYQDMPSLRQYERIKNLPRSVVRFDYGQTTSDRGCWIGFDKQDAMQCVVEVRKGYLPVRDPIGVWRWVPEVGDSESSI